MWTNFRPNPLRPLSPPSPLRPHCPLILLTPNYNNLLHKATQEMNKLLIGAVAAAIVGGWFLWTSDVGSEWKDQIYSYVDNKDIVTLESRFSPQQIVEARRLELVGKEKKEIQEPIVQYYPYLLLDVKYTEDHKPREGALIWGLTNGEIVLNTATWESTHGFKDCLDCDASSQDFKIIQALARRTGSMTLEDLQKDLKLESDSIGAMVDSAKRKHLIVQNGSTIKLHFENPKFLIQPETRIKQDLVSKPSANTEKMPRTYSRGQIITIAKSAFGNDFKIRSEKEIFLPVYRINITNPDGSVYTTHWNALTGQPFLKGV